MTDNIRDYVIGTPSPEEKRLDTWVTAVGHYVSNDYAAPLRTRTEHLIALCQRGGGVLQIGEQIHPFEAGDILYQPAHIPHICACSPNVGWEVWWVIFGGSYAKKLLQLAELSPLTPVITVGQQSKLIDHFQAMYQTVAEKTAETPFLAASHLLSILLQSIATRRQTKAEQFDLLANIDYQTESLDQMVQASGYSKHHFIKKFKQVTGSTPWAYVLRLKIDKAKELLLDEQYSIKQVAALVGIHNPLYFSRLFRKLTGQSPRQFREDGFG